MFPVSEPWTDGNGCSKVTAYTKTSGLLEATGACCSSGPNTTQVHTGSYVETLSDEDTEEDAEKRALAGASPSPGNVVYRTKRTTGFSFDFSSVHYEGHFNICAAGDFQVFVVYTKKNHGGGQPGSENRSFLKQVHLEAGDQVVAGDAVFGDGPFTEKDVDYTISQVELVRLCSDTQPGSPGFAQDSVHFWMELGRVPGNASAGQLRLDAESFTSAIYMPAMLTPPSAVAGSVEVVTNTAGLRQVKAPQTLADVVVIGAAAYEVRFYAPQQIGAQDIATKIYAVSGTPFVVYKLENPDANVTERLRITETRDGQSRETEFRLDSTGTWTLTQGGGLRRESETVTIVNGDTVKTKTIRDAQNQVVAKEARTYRSFPWGEEMIRLVLDPDGAALTTTYDFYSAVPASNPNYRNLRQQTNADGSWARFTYDGSGHIVKTIRPFLNTAPEVTDENQCRVEENSYGSLADSDGDGQPEALRTTIEKVLGQEIARRYRIDWSNAVLLAADGCKRRSEIICLTAGAAWNASDNLVTETLTYATGEFANRARRIVNPDGTATLTTFAFDPDRKLTAIVKSGRPNASADDIVDGTKTVTLISNLGQLISEQIVDIASNLVLSSRIATELDTLGRPLRFDYDNGTFTLQSYACCGLASERDRAGELTTYVYDMLGRRTATTRGGITLRTAYDAAGRVLSVTRVGLDASEITQQIETYDLAGRSLTTRDALNRLTMHAESIDSLTGITTRTTTHPDGGTVIESFARDGSRLAVGGTAAAPHTFDYGTDTAGAFVKDTSVGLDLNNQPTATEWVKNYTDFAGRSAKTVFADGATAQSFYNSSGQLVRQVDPDGVTTLFAYNARGEREVTAVDMNGNNAIDYAGTDRIAKTVNIVASKTDGATYTVQRSTTTVWQADGQDVPDTVSTAEQSSDGLRSWQTAFGLTTKSVTVLDGSGGRTVTTTTPDGVQTVQVFSEGRLSSTSVKTGSNVQIAGSANTYDAHGRLQSSTDARNGATTYVYFADDRIQTVTTPDPDPVRSGPGYDPQVTSYLYDSVGRVQTVTQPDGTVVNTTYWPTGAVKRTWGARTYPVEYTYDPQGRVKTLTTWQNFAGDSGKATTTWNYDPARGLLQNKRYADGSGPAYTYKPSGRLLTRTWARTPTIVTTYGYNAAGDLVTTDYSDATPDVTVAYDRTGRPKSVVDASGSRTLSYHASGQLEGETYTGGLLLGLAVERSFDGLHRPSGISALGGQPSPLASAVYSYDAASRLDTVTAGADSAAYTYALNSSLVGTLTFKHAGAVRLAAAKVYDQLNRLTSVANTLSAQPTAVSYSYTYNAANQRTRVTREDNAYWSFGYDSLGQVTTGSKFLADNTPALGLAHAYTYDDIGNRQTTTVNAQVATYSANAFNQYGQRSVPASLDVAGAAAAGTTVTVTVNNGVPQATTRQGETFYRQIPLDNASTAQNPSLKIVGVKNLVGPNGEDAVTEIARTAFLARSPEVFMHDADGNLTDDARWHYTWDGENRLIAVETSAGAIAAGVVRQKLEFTYDAQGRRVDKKVYAWTGGTGVWALSSELRFLYDGWNLLVELNGLNANAALRTYVWGADLSGSLQGAGGVGGLLSLTDGTSGATHFARYDGNGNLTGLVGAADGASTASYDYNAFGETVSAEGSYAGLNPFGFSTKYADRETGHLYYGYRCYVPEMGRWLSRDPMGENESPNLYGVVGNNLVNHYDLNGLYGEAGHFYTTYLVARAAGYSDARAFQFAYWSQYPDEDSSYEAIKSKQDHLEIQKSIHSLTGGDPSKLRKYLECLLKSDAFGDDEKGLLIHALGDSYAHAYPTQRRLPGRQGGWVPDGGELMNPPVIGHALSGHTPDYIASNPAKYANYVDQLYGVLSSMNGGAPTNPDMIAGLKAAANGLSKPGLVAFFSDTKQNGYESTKIRNLPGGFSGSQRSDYFPENESTPWGGMTRDADFRRRLLDKMKNGVSGCCPN